MSDEIETYVDKETPEQEKIRKRISKAALHVVKRFESDFEKRGFKIERSNFPTGFAKITKLGHMYLWQFYYTFRDGSTGCINLNYNIDKKQFIITSQKNKKETADVKVALRFLRDLLKEKIEPR